MQKFETPHVDVVAAIQKVALTQPSAVAVIDEQAHVTYGELSSEIDRRAQLLIDSGVGQDHRIVLIADNSAMYLATALAVWKVGAVLATLHPASSSSDIEYALETVEPGLAIVSAHLVTGISRVVDDEMPIVEIQDFTLPGTVPSRSPNPTGLRAPLALICFSSGTTSRPKAIMVSSHTVHNTAETYREVWHLDPTDVGVVGLPMAWLYGLASTSLALLVSGATLITLRRGKPELIFDASKAHQATVLTGVTATYAGLVRVMTEQGKGEAFQRLRLCISGGEPPNATLSKHWAEMTDVEIVDAYCASECLPLVTSDPVADPIPVPGAAGKVVPRSHLKVVDPAGNEVAQGELGEAYASGPGLMLGYWGQPELTEEVITSDGWYKMGDLVRIDQDGYVYVEGRLSDIIIRGGTNVSPKEIEAVLNEHPDVELASVVGVPDEMYGQQVVAAIVPSGVFDENTVFEYLKTKLSSYKMPNRLVAVEELPVSDTTQKISKKTLAKTVSEILKS